MAYISMIFSAIASLGVLIGLISGIFFLVFSGLRWASRVRAMLYEEDLCRQKRFLVGNSYVTGSCPPGLTETKKEENSYGGGSILSDSPPKEFQKNDDTQDNQNEKLSKEENTLGEGITADTVHIREFIEKMVETIIGGPLDGITVGKLSNHSAYLGMFTKYHSLLCQELAKLGFALQLSVVHKTDQEFHSSNSSLKRLIKRIVSEAMALPNIKELLCSPKLTEETVNNDFENKSYEDILATAILNKVIEKFQTQIDKKRDNFKNRDKHYKSRTKMEKLKKNRTEDDLMSSSDWSDSSRSDKLSLTIEEYIEEVTTAFEVSDDERSEISDFEPSVHHRVPFPESGRVVRDAQTDDENSEIEEQSSATELITSTNSWEENWLFQKKRLRSTPNAHHPVPVPMLVPNPSEDFRALVGGIDADDLSDMSDSDLILDDISENKTETSTENQKNLLNRTAETFESNDSQEQLVVFKPEKINQNVDEEKENLEKSFSKVVVEETFETYKPEELSLKEIREEVKTVSSSLNSPEFLSQKDRDFSIEDFHLLDHCEVTPSETNCTREVREVNITSSSDSTDKNSFRGSVAEREKEKWNNPVPLAENPYTLENIEKKERNKLEYFRIGTYTDDYIDFPENLSPDELEPTKHETLKFRRDYYVNASKYPSGDSSPSSLHLGYEQVSCHSYDGLSSWNRKFSSKAPKLQAISHDIDGQVKYFSADEDQKNLFSQLKTQTIRSQHFSKVFKTSKYSKEDSMKAKTLWNNRYGCHSLKLRPKIKEPVTRVLFLDQELSDFERKSLREDVNHTVLRAKDASPNFIINPVFNQDATETGPNFNLLSKSLDRRTKCWSDVNFRSENLKPKASSHFKQTLADRKFTNYSKCGRLSQESGYGSDSLDYSSDSLEYWRLTPPKAPEIVESAFVPILKVGKQKKT